MCHKTCQDNCQSLLLQYNPLPKKKGFSELSTKLMRKIADVSQTAEGGSAQRGSTACADMARAAPEGVATCFSFCLDSGAQNNTKPLQFTFYCTAELNWWEIQINNALNQKL